MARTHISVEMIDESAQYSQEWSDELYKPCLAERIGKGFPNFQKMYRKTSHVMTDSVRARR